MNRYGTLSRDKEKKEPICPICGKECERFYKFGGQIIGCDMCVKEVDAYEEMTEE